MVYAIKVRIDDSQAGSFDFEAQKTMYGGKHVAAGDTIFLFASETSGGSGLVASGLVVKAEPVTRKQDGGRATPRVSVSVAHLRPAKKRLGRTELKPFKNWDDGRPETELNFKFYRQATDKLVGISDETAAYLESFF